MNLDFLVLIIYIASACVLFSIRLFAQEDDDIFVRSKLWCFVLRPLILGLLLASVGAALEVNKSTLQTHVNTPLADYLVAPFEFAVLSIVLWGIGKAASMFSRKDCAVCE